MTNQSEIQEALRKFAARDLSDWQGIAAETSLTDVAAHADLDQNIRHRAWLGQAHEPAEWVNASFREYTRGVRVWLKPGHDKIRLMDTERPPLETTALLQNLGPPVAKLDSYLGTFRLPESEWVFPSRGLTLYVNPENSILLRVGVYVPTTLENYRSGTRLDLEMKRLPLSRREEID